MDSAIVTREQLYHSFTYSQSSKMSTTSTTATLSSAVGSSLIVDSSTSLLNSMSCTTSPPLSSSSPSLVTFSTPRTVSEDVGNKVTVEARLLETSSPVGESDVGVTRVTGEQPCSDSNDDSFRTPAPSTMKGNTTMSNSIYLDSLKNNNDGVRTDVTQITPFDGDTSDLVVQNNKTISEQNTFGSQSHPVSRRGGRFVSPSKKTPYYAIPSTPMTNATRDDANGSIKVAVSFKEEDVSVTHGEDDRKINQNESQHVPIIDEDNRNINSYLEFKTFRSSDFDTIIPSADSCERTEVRNSNIIQRRIKSEPISEMPSDTDGPVTSSESNHVPLSSNPVDISQMNLQGSNRAGSNIHESVKSSSHENGGDEEKTEKATQDNVSADVSRRQIYTDDDRDVDNTSKNTEGIHDQKLPSNGVTQYNHQQSTDALESKLTGARCLSPAQGDSGKKSNNGNNSFSFHDVKSPGLSMFWLSPGPPTPKSPGKGVEKSFTKDLFMATPTKLFNRNNFSNPPQSTNGAVDISDSCPDTSISFDSTSNVLAWLQSPSRMFSPTGEFAPSMTNTPLHKTPRTPIISTSFFFSDAASLPKHSLTGEFQPKVTSTTYTINDNVCSTETSRRWRDRDGNNNVICVSPMLYNSTTNEKCDHQPTNSLMNTPAAVTGATPLMGDLHDVFSSPAEKSSSKLISSLPLLDNEDEDDESDGNRRSNIRRRFSNHHLTPRTQRTTIDNTIGNDPEDDGDVINSMHRHLAERELMEDEDLCVLMQLASNNNPNTPRSSSVVFRSSPMARQNYKAGDSVEHERLKEPVCADEGETTTVSQRSSNSAVSTADNPSHHQQKPHEFDPPPTISSMKSNSSTGSSKEMYAGLSKQEHHLHKSSSQQSKDEAETEYAGGRTKGFKENVVGNHAASALASAPATRMIGESPATTSTSSYPIHYQYSNMSLSHPVGYMTPLAMSGSMRVIVGAPPPGAPTSTSQGSGQYSDYHAMSTYAHPGATYGQYPPPPSHHAYGHLGSTSYPAYPPPSHYAVPPPPAQLAQCSSGTLSRAENEYGTPHPIAEKSNAKTGIERGTKHKDNKKTKNSTTKRLSDTKLNSTLKKRKSMPETSSSPPDVPLSSKEIGKNEANSPAKKAKPKLVLASKKSPSSSPGDKGSNTTTCGGGSTKKSKDQSDAAALAAAILRGVTMRPSGKWQAQLYFAGKSRYIGVFDSREKAALAYEIAREKLKNGESGSPDKATTESLVNAARKAAFDGVNSSS